MSDHCRSRVSVNSSGFRVIMFEKGCDNVVRFSHKVRLICYEWKKKNSNMLVFPILYLQNSFQRAFLSVKVSCQNMFPSTHRILSSFQFLEIDCLESISSWKWNRSQTYNEFLSGTGWEQHILEPLNGKNSWQIKNTKKTETSTVWKTYYFGFMFCLDWRNTRENWSFLTECWQRKQVPRVAIWSDTVMAVDKEGRLSSSHPHVDFSAFVKQNKLMG